MGTAKWDARLLGAFGFGKNVVGTETTIGSGKRNIDYIIATLGGNGKAAQVCREYTRNGYRDWFLPSQDELDLMYKNLHQRRLGNFSTVSYHWSSSQLNDESAYCQHFSNGGRSHAEKNVEYYVRPVRMF